METKNKLLTLNLHFFYLQWKKGEPIWNWNLHIFRDTVMLSSQCTSKDTIVTDTLRDNGCQYCNPYVDLIWVCTGVREKIPNLAWTCFLSRLGMRKLMQTWLVLQKTNSMCVSVNSYRTNTTILCFLIHAMHLRKPCVLVIWTKRFTLHIICIFS